MEAVRRNRVFAVAYLALGLAVRNSYYQLIMTLVLIWATMGISWNVLSGYSGMISFGQAAFFGLGGYTMTIAFVKFASRRGSASARHRRRRARRVVIGIPTFRLRGHYFALSMLAYPLACSTSSSGWATQEVSLPMKRETPAGYASSAIRARTSGWR